MMIYIIKSLDWSMPCITKKQNIWDLFSNCRNLSESACMETLNGLRELASTNPELILLHLSDLVEKSSELLIDNDPNVRQASWDYWNLFVQRLQRNYFLHFCPFSVCILLCNDAHFWWHSERLFASSGPAARCLSKVNDPEIHQSLIKLHRADLEAALWRP